MFQINMAVHILFVVFFVTTLITYKSFVFLCNFSRVKLFHVLSYLSRVECFEITLFTLNVLMNWLYMVLDLSITACLVIAFVTNNFITIYSIQQLVMYVLAYTNGAFRWTVSYEGLYCVYLQLGISDVTLGILDTTILCTPFMCFLKLLHLSTQFMHSTPSCQRQVRCTSTIHEYERNWCAPSSIFMHACVVIWIQF